MSTVATTFAEVPQSQERPGWWKWAIAITASLGAVLEVIDTSIVNVALPDMQGNLGATLSEIGWVVTGYAVANVVMIPLSAWLGDYFGKKNYFIFCLVGFTLASVLCGMATTLPMLILARVLQGLAGGGLLAKGQSIIFETFPPHQQNIAQAVFGMGVMVGPALGPTLGGFITDAIGWRWIFFINIPFGILAVIAALIFFYPDKIDPEVRKRKVDWWGIGLLALALSSFQTMLEEGHQEDWFASAFIALMAVLSVVGIILFVWRELTVEHPAVDLRVLRYRSLAAGSVFSALLGMGLYGALFALPIFAQTLLHYNAEKTGFLLLPGAIASAVFMMVGAQLSRKLDNRILIAVGSIILALTMFYLAGINPNTNEDSLYWPLIWRGAGTVLMFMPLTLATLSPIPKQDIAAASGFFNLTRQIGGSIGIAVLTTLLAERQNFHRSVLSEHISLYNPAVRAQIEGMAHHLQQQGTSIGMAKQQALAIMDGMLSQQAAVLSYADIFWFMGMVFVLSLGLLFFLGKGSKAELPIDSH
ncbi:DHA2 family efflux MFS transporter permease subunit [Vampirovibrio sp.]|uniref:DHA2 family efflux MFS transporter permease subunit n=1 Tax=Vampirovibrio sp. TaxID=2717857 RepID=UPI003593113C